MVEKLKAALGTIGTFLLGIIIIAGAKALFHQPTRKPSPPMTDSEIKELIDYRPPAKRIRNITPDAGSEDFLRIQGDSNRYR